MTMVLGGGRGFGHQKILFLHLFDRISRGYRYETFSPWRSTFGITGILVFS
jgi:hypothetical protein